MDEVVRHAEAALRCHPAPAVRLSELLSLVRSRMCDRALTVALLRTVLEARPHEFRILDPWRGPWRAARPPRSGQDEEGDAWVVVVTDPGDQDLPQPRLSRRLRESVRWVARGVDPRSSRELVRWHLLVVAEMDVRDALRLRAA